MGCCRCRVGDRHLHGAVPGPWQPRLCRRAQCGDAGEGGGVVRRRGGEGAAWHEQWATRRFCERRRNGEATGLATGSVRLIVAGQAFHWFDAVKSRAEFVRILRPGGVVVLVWNERLTQSSFEAAYDALIERHGKDYKTTNHRNISDRHIGNFYHPAAYVLRTFPNEQWFDFEGLRGRLLSSSYMPKSGPALAPLIEDLGRLFDTYEDGGRVRVGYETRVFSGVLKS